MSYQMPAINLDAANLSEEERALAQGIVAERGPNKGCLRASKPPVERRPTDRVNKYGNTIYEVTGGEAAYIWRMVAFYASPNPRHQCMPVTAEFDLPGDDITDRQALARRLDGIVDKILATIPPARLHGLMRWGRALGMLD